eukprot:110511-Prymnesium_polylepis.1
MQLWQLVDRMAARATALCTRGSSAHHMRPRELTAAPLSCLHTISSRAHHVVERRRANRSISDRPPGAR